MAKLWPFLNLHSRGLRLEQERSLGDQNQHRLTDPFTEAECSSPWCREGGRRGPGLLPSAHLLSAPALTSSLAHSSKHKVGDRKTCRDKRAFSHCPSAPAKVLRSGWVAVLRAETFTGDHQPWGRPYTPGSTWSSVRGWGSSALHGLQCLVPASTAATPGSATGGHDPTSDRMALGWEDRDPGTHTSSSPKDREQSHPASA